MNEGQEQQPAGSSTLSGFSNQLEEEYLVKLCAEGRSLVVRLLNTRKIPGVAPSDIFQDAIKSALSAYGKETTRYQGDRDFRALLIDIIKKKIINALRASLAQRRDARRQVSTEEAGDLIAPVADDPLMSLIYAETAERILAVCQNVPDEPKSTVWILHATLGHTAVEIREILAEDSNLSQLPALRTIQAWLSELRNMLSESFEKSVE